MKNNLKEKLITSFQAETPNLKDEILDACKNEEQIALDKKAEKKRFPLWLKSVLTVAVCFVLFGVGIFVGNNLPQAQKGLTAETCVYIDVNPSLELSLDSNNRVIVCTAVNEDAQSVLNGMNLTGVELRTALNAIVGSMYVNGYLTQEDNSMLISVDTQTESNTTTLLNYVTTQVNEVFSNSSMECSIIAQGVKANEDLVRRAKENGISVGKMHLVDKMIENFDGLTEDYISNLSNLSIKELNLMYSNGFENQEKPKDDIVSGSVGGVVNKQDAVNAVLTAMQITYEQVDKCEVFVSLSATHGQKGVVYFVVIRLKGEMEVRSFEVDYQTGEVKEMENNQHGQWQGGFEPNGKHD